MIFYYCYSNSRMLIIITALSMFLTYSLEYLYYLIDEKAEISLVNTLSPQYMHFQCRFYFQLIRKFIVLQVVLFTYVLFVITCVPLCDILRLVFGDLS